MSLKTAWIEYIGEPQQMCVLGINVYTRDGLYHLYNTETTFNKQLFDNSLRVSKFNVKRSCAKYSEITNCFEIIIAMQCAWFCEYSWNYLGLATNAAEIIFYFENEQYMDIFKLAS